MKVFPDAGLKASSTRTFRPPEHSGHPNTFSKSLRVLLSDEFSQSDPVGIQQLADSGGVDTCHNNQRGLGINLIKDAQPLHLLRLVLIVFRRAEVMHQTRLVAMKNKQMGEGHQPLLP